MRLCLECGRDISDRPKQSRRCVYCAVKVKAVANLARQRIVRHELRAAGFGSRASLAERQHDEASCPDCHTSLWGAPVRCAIGQRLHDERARAEQARARKPVVMSQREQEDAARIERTLAALAARRRRQRMTLSDEDCWRGAGSMAGAWEGAEA